MSHSMRRRTGPAATGQGMKQLNQQIPLRNRKFPCLIVILILSKKDNSAFSTWLKKKILSIVQLKVPSISPIVYCILFNILTTLFGNICLIHPIYGLSLVLLRNTLPPLSLSSLIDCGPKLVASHCLPRVPLYIFSVLK